MKFRLMLSLLFIIVMSVAAAHEVEHINNTSSDSCLVCIIDDHIVCGDVVVRLKSTKLFKLTAISTNNLVYNLHKKNHSYQNRAPPLKS